VGRVPIYLLDTNLEANHPEDRGLMNKLYAGGPELRLRQEWILGVGGVRVLRAMGVDPAVAAGPFVTTANDITGITIYLTLATIFMEYLR